MELSWVAQVGTVELAFGALTGWIIALSVDRPALVRRAGVRAIPRLRQAHLDYIIMGVILIAAGVAVPDLGVIWAAALVAGAWVNPTLFLPLAFRPEMIHSAAYKAASVASFLAMSAGTVAVAVTALA